MRGEEPCGGRLLGRTRMRRSDIPDVAIPHCLDRYLARRLTVILLIVAAAIGLDARTHGRAAVTCSKTWDHGAASDLWSGANNWNPDGVPGSADVVCIPGLAGASKSG